MSYEKQTWATGDTITANKLNHMEDGISGAGCVLALTAHEDGDNVVLDHTWQEIYDAPLAVLHKEEDGGKIIFSVTQIGGVDGHYGLALVAMDGSGETLEFETSTADGYPAYSNK